MLPQDVHHSDNEPHINVSASKPHARPNILVAVADDWGIAMGGTGSNVSTPTFDRLARDGTLFTHAFAAAPTCTPARSALLFSRWPWRLGAGINMWSVLPLGMPRSYVEILRRVGYHTGCSGKTYGPAGLTGSNYGRHLAGHAGGWDLKAFLKKTAHRPWAFWFGHALTHRDFNGHCQEQCGAKNGTSEDEWVHSYN